MSDDGNQGRARPSLPEALAAVPRTTVEVEEPAMIWGDLKLSDGSILRVRVIVSNVERFDGMKDPFGQPLYTLQTNVVTSVRHAETRAKKEG